MKKKSKDTAELHFNTELCNEPLTKEKTEEAIRSLRRCITNLNVRLKATMESVIVEILPEGSEVECLGDPVTGEDGNEYIQVQNGYCQTRYLS